MNVATFYFQCSLPIENRTLWVGYLMEFGGFMAGSLNKAIIIGRLGTTPELKHTAQGTPVTSFNMATDESYTDKTGNKVEQTEWHRIVVWQRQAENVCKFLQKGSLALVEGRLQTRKWQDQQGQDRYTTEIVCSERHVHGLQAGFRAFAPGARW
jgi:single-strand DNA-binding protein